MSDTMLFPSWRVSSIYTLGSIPQFSLFIISLLVSSVPLSSKGQRDSGIPASFLSFYRLKTVTADASLPSLAVSLLLSIYWISRFGFTAAL